VAVFLLLFGVDVEGYALLFGGGRGVFAACLVPGPCSLALLLDAMSVLEEGPATGSSLLDEGPATGSSLCEEDPATGSYLLTEGSGPDLFLLLGACLSSCSLDSLLDLLGCCFFLDVGPAPDCLPISESPDDLLDLSFDLKDLSSDLLDLSFDLLELSLEGCASFDLLLSSFKGPLLLSFVLSFEGDLLDLLF